MAGRSTRDLALSDRDIVLRRTLRGVWPSLPALAVGSAACCVAAALVILVAPGLTPISPLIAALLAGPTVAALVAVGNGISSGAGATVGDWWRALRSLAAAGVGHGMVAGAALSLFVVALHAWTRTGSGWWLPSVGVTGAAALTASLGLLAVLPLRAAAGTDRRGLAVWVDGLRLVAGHPVPFVAVACVIGLGLWAAVGFAVSLLAVVPGLAAVIDVAAVWTTVGQAPDADDPGPTG
jgi:hypothetical protein